MWSADDSQGDSFLGYRPVFLSSDEDYLFEQTVRAVGVDEGHDEVLVCFRRGVSSGHSWALAGVVAVPEAEVRFGEIVGLDDGPLILLDC